MNRDLLAPVLEAVLTLVERMNSRDISYRDVAAEAGVSVGKLQHHFGSKDELIRSAFEHRLLEVTAAIGAIDKTERTATSRLADAASEASIRGTWRRSTVWVDLVGRTVDDEEYRNLVNRVNDSWRNAFRALIEEGLAAGEFQLHGTVEEAVEQIILAADGLTIRTLADGKDRTDDRKAMMRRLFARVLERELGVAV